MTDGLSYGGILTIEPGVVAPRASAAPPAIARLIGSGGVERLAESSRSEAAFTIWPSALAANAAFALCGVAFAANASRAGADSAVLLFYACMAWLMLPIAFRCILPDAGSRERLALILIATAALFLVKVIRGPIGFIDHDEFLHWATADDILEYGRLFLPNPLLPVSPLYPGLEIVTTALVRLTGLGIFEASVLLLGVARMAFMAGLFLVFARLAGARVAAIACLIYMGSSTFLIFDAHYSYASLAGPLLVFAILADLRSQESGRSWAGIMLVIAPLLAALALTHHLTAIFAAVLLCGFALLECLRKGPKPGLAASLFVGALAVAFPLLWSRLMGNPGAGYLGPVFQNALHELGQLASASTGRQLFTSDDGVTAPLWERYLAISSVGLVSLGLATGFFRTLALGGWRSPSLFSAGKLRDLLRWTDSRLVLLALSTLFFPLSILFRLTRGGWEIGNRIGPFTFFGVGLVCAIAIAAFWQGRSRAWPRAALIAAACVVILIGGVISSEGPRILVPRDFKVSADSASIEPMSISAADWTQEWLGGGNLFASDRINRLLLATHGRQRVTTTLQDGLDAGVVILSDRFGPSEAGVLKTIGVDYLMIDFRLTTALPVVGVYFDGGEADRNITAPPRAQALMKFNHQAGIGRPFDNGNVAIFDVRTIGR